MRRGAGRRREAVLAGRDFEAFDYPDGCIVVDNQPFSILARIQDFYLGRGFGLLKRKRAAEHIRPTARD